MTGKRLACLAAVLAWLVAAGCDGDDGEGTGDVRGGGNGDVRGGGDGAGEDDASGSPDTGGGFPDTSAGGEDAGGGLPDTGGGGGDDVGTGGGDTATGGDVPLPSPDTCDHTGYTAAAESGEFGAVEGGFLLFYYGDSSETPPSDQLDVEIYAVPEYGGPTTAGTYAIDDTNYADCGLCVVGGRGCEEGGCEAIFLAFDGELEITAFPTAAGDPFGGTLRDVRLREVTIDPQDFVSTPVEGGALWCVPGFSFLVTTDPAPAE